MERWGGCRSQLGKVEEGVVDHTISRTQDQGEERPGVWEDMVIQLPAVLSSPLPRAWDAGPGMQGLSKHVAGGQRQQP